MGRFKDHSPPQSACHRLHYERVKEGNEHAFKTDSKQMLLTVNQGELSVNGMLATRPFSSGESGRQAKDNGNDEGAIREVEATMKEENKEYD